MSDSEPKGCGKRHLTLAIAIIVLIAGLVGGITASAISYEDAKIAKADERMRTLETSYSGHVAGQEAEYKEIRRSLDRIESQLEKGPSR